MEKLLLHLPIDDFTEKRGIFARTEFLPTNSKLWVSNLLHPLLATPLPIRANCEALHQKTLCCRKESSIFLSLIKSSHSKLSLLSIEHGVMDGLSTDDNISDFAPLKTRKSFVRHVIE